MPVTININGVDHEVDATPDTPLLWVVRDHIQLTGTKFGCGLAQCGSCTVHMDGLPIRSCVTPVAAVLNNKITTIEGINSPAAKAIQQAWTELEVPQCGYCQSGQIMAATALLESNPAPDSEAIENAMSGNICRCATYVRIRKAIELASKRLA